jgi:soluble lytic murein transglycosylase-like protein
MPIPHGRPTSPQPNPSSFPAILAAADCPPRRLLNVAIVAIMLFGGVARAESVSAPVGSVAPFIDEAAQRFGIATFWIRAVLRAESGGDAHALSPKGAMGLMQLMPQTWAVLRSRYRLGADPYDAHDNILAGAAYLRELHDRYGSPGFLAAYNAGPVRYEDHLATGRPLPTETRAYLAVLAPLIDDDPAGGMVPVDAVAPSWTEAPLFAARAESRVAAQSGGLFVQRRALPERAP